MRQRRHTDQDVITAVRASHSVARVPTSAGPFPDRGQLQGDVRAFYPARARHLSLYRAGTPPGETTRVDAPQVPHRHSGRELYLPGDVPSEGPTTPRGPAGQPLCGVS